MNLTELTKSTERRVNDTGTSGNGKSISEKDLVVKNQRKRSLGTAGLTNDDLTLVTAIPTDPLVNPLIGNNSTSVKHGIQLQDKSNEHGIDTECKASVKRVRLQGSGNSDGDGENRILGKRKISTMNSWTQWVVSTLSVCHESFYQKLNRNTWVQQQSHRQDTTLKSNDTKLTESESESENESETSASSWENHSLIRQSSDIDADWMEITDQIHRAFICILAPCLGRWVGRKVAWWVWDNFLFTRFRK